MEEGRENDEPGSLFETLSPILFRITKRGASMLRFNVCIVYNNNKVKNQYRDLTFDLSRISFEASVSSHIVHRSLSIM